MKKKFILAIFGISLLFMSCQENSYYNNYDMGDENLSILTEAMKLIEDNHDFVSLPDLGKTLKDGSATRSSGSNQSLRYEEENFIFDWGEADVITSKLAEAVIVPVKYNKGIALRSVTLEGNKRRKETTPLYSILYMRKMLKTEQTHAHILSFAPDREYVNACEESGEELQLFPNPQGSNFSGILFFSTIYGEITHGIRYENGRKCYYIMPRSERNRDFIEQYRHEHDCTHKCDSAHTHIKMSLEFVTSISATRSTYSNNSEDYNNLTCSFCGKNVNDCTCVEIVACGVCKKQPCICYIEDEEEQKCNYCGFPIGYCHCNNSGGSQGSSSGSSPGSGNGTTSGNVGSNTNENAGNNNGNDTGTSTDGTINNHNELFNKLGTVDPSIAGANLIILKHLIYDWYKDNQFNYDILNLLLEQTPNITFSFNPNILAGGFDGLKNMILFYNEEHFSPYVIGEELIHATQFHCFYHNQVDVKRREMEAKAIYDIIFCSKLIAEGLSPAPPNSSYYGIDVIDEYIDWILGGNYSDYNTRFEKWITYFNYSGGVHNVSSKYVMFNWFYYKYFKK